MPRLNPPEISRYGGLPFRFIQDANNFNSTALQGIDFVSQIKGPLSPTLDTSNQQAVPSSKDSQLTPDEALDQLEAVTDKMEALAPNVPDELQDQFNRLLQQVGS